MLLVETKKRTIDERFYDHWARFVTLAQIAGPVADKVYQELFTAYGEDWRTYHGRKHPVLLLDELESLRSQRPTWFIDRVFSIGVEFSLWIHDRKAHPKEIASELWCAERGRDLIEELGYPQLMGMVYRCTRATEHGRLAKELDEQIVADIDLSLLACRFEEFRQTTADIRQEQVHKSDAEFRAGQRAFLGHLQARGVYATRHFYHELEESAQANIARSLVEQAEP